jgi:hypothetical protein
MNTNLSSFRTIQGEAMLILPPKSTSHNCFRNYISSTFSWRETSSPAKLYSTSIVSSIQRIAIREEVHGFLRLCTLTFRARDLTDHDDGFGHNR